MRECKNCGAAYGIHHYDTHQCPAFGVEAPTPQEQMWNYTTYEESPLPKPDRPTGPTLEYVRELEALVSEAVDIFKNMLVQDDSGLVFISSVGGRVIDRAVAFVAAAKDDES